MKGCPQCTKRRIRCDLGQPECSKCLKKGFECPGYGNKLRWVGAPATRGKLKRFHHAGSSRQTRPKPITPAANTEYAVQELIDYYDSKIAKIMVWVDSADNVYRYEVIPLANRHEAVRLAITAVVTKHAAVVEGKPDTSECSRDLAVSMITECIGHVTRQVEGGLDIGTGLDSDTADWILASMLVLSCYEMVDSGASAADFHRKAARSFVNTLSATECRTSPLYVSLRNKLSTYEVLACTTSFDLHTIQNAVLPEPSCQVGIPNETVLFTDFLSQLHAVTLLARQRQRQGPPCPEDTGLDWRTSFEDARGATLMTAGKLTMAPHQRRGLVRLADIHHSAAVLYATRCLRIQRGDEFTAALADLRRQLLALEDIKNWAQNLPWPIFILGTESHGDQRNQEVVIGLYGLIIEVIPMKQYAEVLEFLKEFWSGNELDWQVVARDWEAAGKRILVY